MRPYVRELVFGCVLAIVSNIAVLLIVESSSFLTEKLGLYSNSWVNGMLFVEILRMAVVGLFTLLAIRQRHGLRSRGEGIGYVVAVAGSSWLVTMLVVTVLGFIAGETFVSWSDLTSLIVWLSGAVLAPIFVVPGDRTGETNRYIARLDRERSENAGW